MITDDFIDDESIRIWTCFTDTDINKLLDGSCQFSTLTETEALNGSEWRDLPFWGKVRDFIVPGTNIDGSKKGWFDYRKFPTKTVRAADLTANMAVKLLKDGYNIKVDYSGATGEQASKASHIVSKMFDREFLIAHAQAAKDASNIAGAAGTVAGGISGGAPGAVAGGTAAKGYVLKKSDEIVNRFNDAVKNTEYEPLAITRADRHESWFDVLVKFVFAHPYVSTATVIALVIAFKNRTWIWDRIKLGFSNLWQGKVIAKYFFDLKDGTQLSFEYDLRFNKWRLLYRNFRWRGNAAPPREDIVSFLKTRYCKEFIEICGKYIDKWFRYEDLLRDAAEMIEDSKYKNAAKMILAVLDDKEDIRRSFTQLAYRVG